MIGDYIMHQVKQNCGHNKYLKIINLDNNNFFFPKLVLFI